MSLTYRLYINMVDVVSLGLLSCKSSSILVMMEVLNVEVAKADEAKVEKVNAQKVLTG